MAVSTFFLLKALPQSPRIYRFCDFLFFSLSLVWFNVLKYSRYRDMLCEAISESGIFRNQLQARDECSNFADGSRTFAKFHAGTCAGSAISISKVRRCFRWEISASLVYAHTIPAKLAHARGICLIAGVKGYDEGGGRLGDERGRAPASNSIRKFIPRRLMRERTRERSEVAPRFGLAPAVAPRIAASNAEERLSKINRCWDPSAILESVRVKKKEERSLERRYQHVAGRGSSDGSRVARERRFVRFICRRAIMQHTRALFVKCIVSCANPVP